jgi:hypothetical protein
MVSKAVASLSQRVAERRRAVALAHHFREAEGLSIGQIADLLGRSPATIKAYFYDPTGEKARAVKARYRGVCRGCGAYTQPRNGKGDAYAYCKACHPGAIERRWTRERVIGAMLEWRVRYGQLPSSYDWSSTHALRRGGEAQARGSYRRLALCKRRRRLIRALAAGPRRCYQSRVSSRWSEPRDRGLCPRAIAPGNTGRDVSAPGLYLEARDRSCGQKEEQTAVERRHVGRRCSPGCRHVAPQCGCLVPSRVGSAGGGQRGCGCEHDPDRAAGATPVLHA